MVNDKPFIICFYMKECKICQIVNEFLDYLHSINKIKYIRINLYKIVPEFLTFFKFNDIKETPITTPCVYLENNDKFIRIDSAKLLSISINYKKSLINRPKKQSFLDSIMIPNH